MITLVLYITILHPLRKQITWFWTTLFFRLSFKKPPILNTKNQFLAFFPLYVEHISKRGGRPCSARSLRHPERDSAGSVLWPPQRGLLHGFSMVSTSSYGLWIHYSWQLMSSWFFQSPYKSPYQIISSWEMFSLISAC